MTQTRDLQVGLGGFTRRCGLALGPRGLCVGGAWGAKALQDVSHGGFTEGVEVSQAWNKTGGELGLFGGGVQIAVLTAGEKISPQILKPTFM